MVSDLLELLGLVTRHFCIQFLWQDGPAKKRDKLTSERTKLTYRDL